MIPIDTRRHVRLRVIVETAAERPDGRALLLMSEADVVQFEQGRKPCGKMGIDPSLPGYLLITDENLKKMGEQGVRCSWQTGDNTPEKLRLTPEQLVRQANIYAEARGKNELFFNGTALG